MTEHDGVLALRSFLETQPKGPIADIGRVSSLVYDSWEALSVSDYTRMRADKLSRMEKPTWKPPHLEFWIERHGQTVMGSTRATDYRWQVNMQTLTASVIEEKRLQLDPMDKPLDVRPIAESLAAAIIGGVTDDRLKPQKDGSVRLDIQKIIPATNNQTTADRRARLRRHLDTLLKAQGWKTISPNVYKRGI